MKQNPSSPVKDFLLTLFFIGMLTLIGSLAMHANGQTIPYFTPDQFGAKHQLITLGQLGKTQAYCDATYPGLFVTTATQVDAAAWRKALSKGATEGKMIIAFGTYYFGNDSAMLPKNFRVISITGTPYINVTGTNGAPVFTRPKPIDNSDANIMINAFVNIDGLQIGCQTGGMANRIGIDIGPTYNSRYVKVDCFSLSEAIHLRFALNTEVDNCEATNCRSGWFADIGNWPGAGNSNSQSNNTSFFQCRYYGDSQTMALIRSVFPDYKELMEAEKKATFKLPAGQKTMYQKILDLVNGPSAGLLKTTSGGVAYGIYGSSGVNIEQYIIEGASIAAGIDYDALGSTVVKGGNYKFGHFECVNGASVAIVKIRAAGGVFVIDNIFSQYPAYIIDAEASAGYPFIEVTHLPYNVPKNGKYFLNNGFNWALNYNDNFPTNTAELANMFGGVIPSYCPVPNGGCGANSMNALLISR